ncbi:MAG: NAD-dependent epimerase/dehydratase family protein [Methanogenium sp.]|jgi:nucleoside-diphosphate-sugar epimerase
MKRILVCGADGFTGRNIVEYFNNILDYDVYGTYCLGNPIEQSILKGDHLFGIDLTKKEHVGDIFKRVEPDIVIQAAAVTSGSKDITERPYIHTTDNAIMNSLILRACYEHSVKHFLFLSCCVMYQPGDELRKESDFNEHDELHKNYFGVGWTKVYIEKMCEFYSRLGRTKHTVIRHSNTYGPYDKYDLEHSHVFGATIRKVMDAKDGDSIIVWGNGEDTARDLIYVEDVVRFMENAIDIQTTPYELVNVSYGRAITVKEMVENIIFQSDKDLKIVYDTSKPSIPTRLALDWEKASKLFRWTPTISFQEGVHKTIEWYKDYYGIKKYGSEK